VIAICKNPSGTSTDISPGIGKKDAQHQVELYHKGTLYIPFFVYDPNYSHNTLTTDTQNQQ